MKVSIQYADDQLSEQLPISESDAGKAAEPASRRGLWGAGRGEIWIADDWNSPATKEEVASLFLDGPVFPNEPTA